ncbi:MAG: L-2-hydroxyglutarate oxidase [Gemmatimonadota bacterium]
MPAETLLVVGGGIVGLATAERWLQRHPAHEVVVLEKEPGLATHQTGRNSGVLHSGIYYRPGSAKARNCIRGKQLMESFCREQGIPFETCGKVIVATTEAERPRLAEILERGHANGVDCRRIDAAELEELEPHAAGLEAIHVPGAGIVDYREVALRLGERIEQHGGRIRTAFPVTALEVRAGQVVAHGPEGEEIGTRAVACAGLFSDRLARASGLDPGVQIVPFRGEYYELSEQARGLCRNLIYPVPDPAFPFLGVHFTRMVGGGVECGPNAVFAFAREGYHRTDVDVADLFEALGWPGVWRLFARHWETGLGEMWRSWSKSAFVRALQRLVPEIRAEQLSPAPAGVRAMALGRDGSLVDDYLIRREGPIIHVCNAPSPAATSALSIGETVVALAEVD